MVETDAEFIARVKAIAEGGRPIYELSIKRLIAMVEDRERERDEAQYAVERYCADSNRDLARAEAAESAQREAVAEAARLREALRTIRDEGNGWAVSVAIGALPKETAHD